MEVDTYHSGWYNVATAFAKYAMSVTNNNTNANTYIDVINKFMAENAGAQNNDPAKGPTTDFVRKVMNYFDFDNSATDTTSNVTLSIGTGFDILAWDEIKDIETDRAYYKTTITFAPVTNKGGVGFRALNGESTISINTVKDVDPDGGKNADVKFIKSALEKCVADDAFKKWFALDLNSMSVDEIMTLVQGETSCANVLKVFGDAVALCGYNTTADELWDHYVKDTVGKSYAETQEWVNNGLMEAIYHAYALDYKRQFDEKMAVDYSVFTAEEIFAHYNSVVAIQQSLENQTNYKNENISAEIIDEMNRLEKGYTKVVEGYITTLSNDVSKAYAKKYADDFNALIETGKSFTFYDTSDPNAADAWKASAEPAAVREYIRNATALLANVDTYVLSFAQAEGDAKFDIFKDSYSDTNKKTYYKSYI